MKGKVFLLFIFFVSSLGICFGQEQKGFPFSMQQFQVNNTAENLDNFPIPPTTQEIKLPDAPKGFKLPNLADSPYAPDLNKMKRYRSKLSVEELKEFYKIKLSQFGWKPLEILGNLGDLGGMFGFDTDQLGAITQNSLMLTKNKNMLTIVFIPEGETTRYSLSIKSMPSLNDVSSQVPGLPGQDKQKPKGKRETFMPLYPKATEIRYFEEFGTVNASYGIDDDAETIATFYRNNMPKYGWQLKQEKDSGQKSMDEISTQCPTCPKLPQSYQSIVQNATFGNQKLDFINKRGDKCQIRITRATGLNMPFAPSQGDLTTINVKYKKAN